MEGGEGVQEGGTLMGLCRYEGETQVVVLRRTSMLEELYSMVRERWRQLGERSVRVSYQEPVEKEWVKLLSDEDVGNMVQLHEVVKAVVCKLAVERGEIAG